MLHCVLVSYTRATEYWNSSCEYLSFQAAKIVKPNKSVLQFYSNMTEHVYKDLIQAHIVMLVLMCHFFPLFFCAVKRDVCIYIRFWTLDFKRQIYGFL